MRSTRDVGKKSPKSETGDRTNLLCPTHGAILPKESAKFRPSWAEFGRCFPTSGQSRPNSGQHWQNLLPNNLRKSVEVGPHLTTLSDTRASSDNPWANFGHLPAKLGEHRPSFANSGRSWPKQGQLWPISVNEMPWSDERGTDATAVRMLGRGPRGV